MLKVKGLDVLDGTPLTLTLSLLPLRMTPLREMRYPDWVNKLEY